MKQRIDVSMAIDVEIPPNVSKTELAESALQQITAAACSWPGWRAQQIDVDVDGAKAGYAHSSSVAHTGLL